MTFHSLRLLGILQKNVDAIEVLSPSAMLRLGGAGNSFREEDEEFDEEENNDD